MSGRYQYPLVAENLSSAEMKQLTGVLYFDMDMSEDRAARKVGEKISKLPQRLRRSLAYRLVPKSKTRPGLICAVHKGINPYVIGDIVGLLGNEVTSHFKCMDKFPELVPPDETLIVIHLKAIQGMWLEPWLHSDLPEGAWRFQENGCHACMLSRIAVNRDILCELRMAILSRTRTRRKHHAPRLLSFVEECIGQHESWVIDVCYYSAQRAYAFKEARKAAVKAYFKWDRDSKFKYVLRDNETGAASNHTYQDPPSAHPQSGSISPPEAEHDKRLDSILAGYGPTMDAEAARTVLSTVHGVPAVPDPLRIRKVGREQPYGSSPTNPHWQQNRPRSNTTQSREPSSYVPPRNNLYWQQGRQRSNTTLSHEPSPYVPPRSNPHWQQGYGSYPDSSSRQRSSHHSQRSSSSRRTLRQSPLLPSRDNPYVQAGRNPYESSLQPPAHAPPRSDARREHNYSPRSTPSAARESSSRYVPARDNRHWQQGYGSHYAIASAAGRGNGKEREPDVEELAGQYRDLLTPAAEYFSESEYSDGGWTDASVHETASAATTTWSFVMGDHDRYDRRGRR